MDIQKTKYIPILSKNLKIFTECRNFLSLKSCTSKKKYMF